MSEELMAVTRILELTTKAGVEIVKLGAHCSLASYQHMRDIYHAHVLEQAGEMTYARLLQHVGSDTQFLNFHTEDAKELEHLKAGMTEYKISFVQMPDMCQGDGFTQFMVDASDAAKVNAFLKNYTKVAHDYMTADGYSATGSKEDWEKLHEKALHEKELQGKDKAAGREESKEPAYTGKSDGKDDPALKELRSDEIYRTAAKQPGSVRHYFSRRDMLAETEGSYAFRLPGSSDRLADQEQVFVVPKEHVRLTQGRYSAILLPDKEYAVLPAAGKIQQPGKDTLQVLNISGRDLGDLLAEHSLKKTEAVAQSLAKKLADFPMDTLEKDKTDGRAF